jgi:hypothetical protein
MFVNPTRAQKITAACCILHNFLLQEFKDEYCPQGFADTYDENGNLQEGSWRKQIPENSLFEADLSNQNNGRVSEVAKSIREHLKMYFNSDTGSLRWQNSII